jgi:hypothetical protein
MPILDHGCARLLIYLLALGIVHGAYAQSRQDTNVNAWFMYFGDHPLNDKWGIHLEGQVRRADSGLTWQQFIIRPAVNYQVNDRLMLTAGYAFVEAWPYGDFPAKAPFPEHGFYEQALIKQKLSSIPLQHRLRVDQRLVGLVPAPHAAVHSWQLRQRFRYMLRADFPLPLGDGKRRPFGLAIYDEVFVNFGADRGMRYPDQNRAYAALRYKLNQWNRLEVGYLNQYIAQRNGLITELNHTPQFAWYLRRLSVVKK